MIEKYLAELFQSPAGVASLVAIAMSAVAILRKPRSNTCSREVEEKVSSLEKEVFKIKAFLSNPFDPALNPNQDAPVVWCPEHGRVTPIILPDSTILCPKGLHRIYPKPPLMQDLKEDQHTVKLELGEDGVKVEPVETRGELSEVVEDLRKLERISYSGSAVVLDEEAVKRMEKLVENLKKRLKEEKRKKKEKKPREEDVEAPDLSKSMAEEFSEWAEPVEEG